MRSSVTYLFLFLGMILNAQVNLLPDTTGICSGDVSFLKIEKKLDKNARITWYDPYAGITEQQIAGVANQQFIPKYPIIKPGKYGVKIVSGKNTWTDTTVVLVNVKPTLGLRDTTLCKGKKLILDAKNQKMRYTWSTGETSQKIKVESSGNYWVKVNNNGCVQYDTVNVKFIQGSIPSFNSEVTFCLSDENKTLSIKALPNSKIMWSTGSVYPSTSVIKPGIYWVKTENKNCGEQIDSVNVIMKACDCEMLIPNSFTPNEDNKNDYFFPVLQCEYSAFVLTISDRWGNVVFSTSNPTARWDGRFKGNLCQEDVYVYEIESIERSTGKKVARSGKVSLFR